jgi:hypothetical protein
MKEDQLLQLVPYFISQKQVANETVSHNSLWSLFRLMTLVYTFKCASPSGKHTPNPEWYECHRTHRENGVFETAVQLEVPNDSESEMVGKLRQEWLYAPHVSAMLRAAGPKVWENDFFVSLHQVISNRTLFRFLLIERSKLRVPICLLQVCRHMF